MSDERTGLTGVEVEPKPQSHQQGKELTCHKVNLHRDTETVLQVYVISMNQLAKAMPNASIGETNNNVIGDSKPHK